MTHPGATAGRLAAVVLLLGAVQGCAVLDHLSPSRQRGLASWYGPDFYGETTAGGTLYALYPPNGGATSRKIPDRGPAAGSRRFRSRAELHVAMQQRKRLNNRLHMLIF